ncbi:MAG: orotidine-5'-phosphate decarboxylase [Rhodospirillales bacterium]|nr:orotidine-5'-phosphate decarboxylase [Rhodospirillales bacterium]
MTVPHALHERIFVALDTADLAQAQRLVAATRGLVGGYKLGKEFFTAHGPQGVRQAVGAAPLFLDLKFHDIPNTVAGAVRAARALSPRFMTLHASGGPAMMQAAADAAAAGGADRTRLLAVSVLTSLDDRDLGAMGQHGPVEMQVARLAKLAADCGMDGAVCSPLEVVTLRGLLPEAFALMVPGVRPTWAASGDQKRVMTPADALALGASYLVIGRPITAAEDPAKAAGRIVDQLTDLGAP